MKLHKPGWKRQKLVEKIQLAKDFKDKNKSIMLQQHFFFIYIKPRSNGTDDRGH